MPGPSPPFDDFLRPRRRPWAGLLLAAILLLLVAFCGAVAFYDRYYRASHDPGRYYEETGMTYNEAAGYIWGGCFVVTFIPALVLLSIAIRRVRHNQRAGF